jgi:hypothetical protein
LHSVAARFVAEHWEALGRAVLYEVRGAGLPAVMKSPSARAVREARRVLKMSRIVSVITAPAFRRLDTNARRGAAVLAIVEADPGLLQRNTAETVINVIADAIALPQVDVESELGEPAGSQTAATTATTQATTAANRVQDKPSQPQRNRTSSDQAAPSLSSRPERQISEPAGNRSHKRVTDQWSRQSSAEQTELVDLRRRAISRCAGLLYLIGVIQDLELPEQIAANEFLGQRPLPWVLHQLALVLAPIEARDPAALAFAGLAPDAKPAWQDEAAPTEAETRMLKTLADQIVTHLATLFEADELTEISPLEFVTRRRGEIVADTGWLEVRFSVDDVTTEIRRAGLDLNPGYVPWLGLVVMFDYE